MKRLWIVFALLTMLCCAGAAEGAGMTYPVCAWTTREVNMVEQPREDAACCSMMAEGCRVTWLDTQGEWALIDAQGMNGYVPADSLTLDRVFDFEGFSAKNMEWPYEGEVRVSPDGRVRITIQIKAEYTDGLLFGGADLCCFEVIDESSGELICTAQPDLSRDPVVYSGEGVYTQGTSLLVVPVLRHNGYSVEIEW